MHLLFAAKHRKMGLMLTSCQVRYNIYKCKWISMDTSEVVRLYVLEISAVVYMCQKQELLILSCQKALSFVGLSKKNEADNWSRITDSWLRALGAISHQIFQCFFKHSFSVTWPQPPARNSLLHCSRWNWPWLEDTESDNMGDFIFTVCQSTLPTVLLSELS